MLFLILRYNKESGILQMRGIMKNLLRLSCTSLLACALFTPLQAMNIYQTPNGRIFVETTSCQDKQRLWQAAEENTEPQTLAEQDEPDTPQGDPAASPLKFSEQDFNVAQSKLVVFVHAVNWKTGIHLTSRDANLMRRIKTACAEIVAAEESLDPDTKAYLIEVQDGIIDEIEKGITRSAFRQLAKMTTWGIHDAIVTDQPFLLLIIDEETYKEIVALDPKVQELADNMYTFFAYRAAYMGDGYDQNTDELINLSRYGKGDAVSTWALFAQFATYMYELQQQNDLTPELEKEAHLWKLNAFVQKIHQKVKVEKKATKMARKDPNNAALMEKIKKEMPRKLSTKKQAQQLLQEATQEQVEELLRRRYSK